MVASNKLSSDGSRVSTPTRVGAGHRYPSNRSISSVHGSNIYDSSPPLYSQLQHHSRERSSNSCSSRRGQISSSVPPIVQVENFKKELEEEYQLKKNHRCQKFIAQFPTGEVPKDKQIEFTQAEAVERTKFVVLKDSQVLQFELDLITTSPIKAPVIMSTDSSSLHEPLPRSIGRFEIGKQKTPPRFDPFSNSAIMSTDNATNGYAELQATPSGTSLQAVLPSPINPDPEMNLPIGTTQAVEKPDEPTKDQSTRLLIKCCADIRNLQVENARLEQDLRIMKHDMALLRSDSETTKFVNKISELEQNIANLTSFLISLDLPMMSYQFGSFHANMTQELDDIKQVMKHIEALQDTYVTKRTFDHENQFNKLTFNGKTQLIEKYLGIDITTTGPKPHNVLEALHSRIWYLESFINPMDVASTCGKEYKSLNDLMKNPITRDNAMIGYSASPGYATSSKVSNQNSRHGGAGGPSRDRSSHRRGANNLLGTQAPNMTAQSTQMVMRHRLATAQVERNDLCHQAPAHASALQMPDSILAGDFAKDDHSDTWLNDHVNATQDLNAHQNTVHTNGPYHSGLPMPQTDTMNNFVFPNGVQHISDTAPYVYASGSSGSEFGVIGSGRPKSPPESSSATASVETRAIKPPETNKEQASIKAARELVNRESANREAVRQDALKEAAAKARFMQKPGDFTGKRLLGLGQK